MKDWKPTIAIDFDGVIHAYSKGWEDGVVYDDPMEGAIEALEELSDRYEVVVFTARTELEPVREWMLEHFPKLAHTVTNNKPKAKLYIDDRAVHFRNWDECLADIAFLEEDESLKWSPYASDGKLIK